MSFPTYNPSRSIYSSSTQSWKLSRKQCRIIIHKGWSPAADIGLYSCSTDNSKWRNIWHRKAYPAPCATNYTWKGPKFRRKWWLPTRQTKPGARYNLQIDLHQIQTLPALRGAPYLVENTEEKKRMFVEHSHLWDRTVPGWNSLRNEQSLARTGP